MEQVSLDVLLQMFAGVASGRQPDPGLQQQVCDLYARSDTAAVVLFRNEAMDSSECGRMTVLGVGEGFTCKTVEEVEGMWLNDLPSQRQYPVVYCKKDPAFL